MMPIARLTRKLQRIFEDNTEMVQVLRETEYILRDFGAKNKNSRKAALIVRIKMAGKINSILARFDARTTRTRR